MIGIDLTNKNRFENASESFVKKILSKDEILEYKNSKDKVSFLAKRWAIKEAIFKADNSKVSFNKISIKKENNKYTYEDFEISTSSEGEAIIAIALKR